MKKSGRSRIWRWLRRLLLLCLLTPLLLVGLLLTWVFWPDPELPKASPPQHYLKHPRPLILAHQGASGHAPSNTLESFRQAKVMHADVLEMDVQLTADKHVVVSHDTTLDRHTNGIGSIQSYTLSAIKQFDAGYRFSQGDKDFPYRGKGITIPTLEEVFRAFPKMRMNIELKQKDPALVRAVWRLIQRYKRQQSVLIGSFHDSALKEWRAHTQGQTLTSASVREALRFIIAEGIGWGDSVQPQYQAFQLPPGLPKLPTLTTNDDFLKLVRQKKLKIHYWTINDPKEMKRLIQRGADGLITDYPDRAWRVLKALGMRPASAR